MNSEFKPQLEILPPPQRRLWAELVAVPADFVLWGGTALALHLGHRPSVDFDFFSTTAVDLDAFASRCDLLAGSRVLQRTPGSLTCSVDRDGEVKLSFFVVPGVLKAIRTPFRAAGNGLRVASLIDLSAMKVKVVCDRAEAKDYIDVDAILQRTGITLAEALSAAGMVYGASYSPFPSMKALTFFEDGDLHRLSGDVRGRLVAAVRGVDPARLPQLQRQMDDEEGSS